jgi:uncharacterized membrane protein YedE/YeeE
MDPLSLASLVSGASQLLSSARDSLWQDRRDFGILPALALRFGLFEAKGLVYEVREQFIKGDGGLDQAMAFKDSYTPTFNMVGVAGAIIAQIALTALSLPNLDDTHWTARASFVIGLVAGSLAVFCCCVLQSKMSALHTAHGVRRWLTRPRKESWEMRSMISDRDMASAVKDHIRNPDASHPLDLTDMKQQLSRFNETFNEEAYRPSLSAALIITAPLQLLNIALGSLLTGFGIYFGFVYSAKLPTIGDHHSALAVLVVYITSAASGLLFFYIPVLIKRAATMRDQKDGGDAAELVDMLEIAIQATQRGDAATKQDGAWSALNQVISLQATQLQDAASKQDGILSALTRIVSLQEEQLKLQKDFQALLEARLHPSSAQT